MLSDSNSFEAMEMRLRTLWKPLLTREQAVQAEKKGLPIELESDSISGWNRTKNKKIINPVDKVNSKWYIYKRRKC